MKNLLIIFKGWSSTNSLYKGVEELEEFKGWDICYSDSGSAPVISDYDKVVLIAWSMGTLDAIEFEISNESNKISNMILISPTLDFTSTTKPIILKKMIKRLGKDRGGCLEDFTKLCFATEDEEKRYWNCYKNEILEIPETILVEGLEKLLNKKIDIIKIGKEIEIDRKISPLFIVGSKDIVIPKSNSKQVEALYLNGTLVEIEAGHNMFFDMKDRLLEEIKKEILK